MSACTYSVCVCVFGGNETVQHVCTGICIHVCVYVRVCASKGRVGEWVFVCNHVRQAVMNGVFETERSVEFLGLDQIGNRKTNIPQEPPLSTSPPPPLHPRLPASGAVQPVWDNVTVYSRTGPHTFAEGGQSAGGGGCGGGESCGGGNLSHNDSWKNRQKKHMKMTESSVMD